MPFDHSNDENSFNRTGSQPYQRDGIRQDGSRQNYGGFHPQPGRNVQGDSATSWNRKAAPNNSVPDWKLHLDYIQVAVSAGAGFVLWLLCDFMYGIHSSEWSSPVLIGLLFSLLAVGVSAAVFTVSRLRDTFRIFLFPNVLPIVPALIFLLFASGALFQWLYSLDMKLSPIMPTSYLFIIDDSGSMTQSDQDGQRYQAVRTVLDGVGDDFPFAVYNFATSPVVLRKMAPKSEGIGELSGFSDGLTDIPAALDLVLQEYRSSGWSGGNSPRAILLTDGENTGSDERIESLLKEYQREGISISTVGLGNGVNTRLLENIAQSTGGVFISVDQASSLNEAMKSAVYLSAGRNLISARRMGNPLIYGTMRVVFLLILGLVLQSAIVLSYGGPDKIWRGIGCSMIPTALGALMMEIFSLLLPESLLRFLLWGLFALTFVQEEERHQIINDYRQGFRPPTSRGITGKRYKKPPTINI